MSALDRQAAKARCEAEPGPFVIEVGEADYGAGWIPTYTIEPHGFTTTVQWRAEHVRDCLNDLPAALAEIEALDATIAKLTTEHNFAIRDAFEARIDRDFADVQRDAANDELARVRALVLQAADASNPDDVGADDFDLLDRLLADAARDGRQS